ncbi:hypothetical protein JXO52_16720 [bacterium]|nr:hypothetical protein [bacterium]
MKDPVRIQIDPKAKACPGVADGVLLTVDALGKVKQLYTVGQLIHNEREVARLVKLGLKIIQPAFILGLDPKVKLKQTGFLIRCHGEPAELIGLAKDAGMKVYDATCSIVKRSQKIVREHAREAYRILIAGKPGHAEVVGLLDASMGTGIVVSGPGDIETLEIENRTLLIAQTTIDPASFAEITEAARNRIPGVKIIDTTCRFITNRLEDMRDFGQRHDVVLLVGGKKSSNCRLLYEQLMNVNRRSYKVASPEDVDPAWLGGASSIGITGAASTPSWQLEEMHDFIENIVNNPKGLNNRKGGKRTWRIWKSQKKTV